MDSVAHVRGRPRFTTWMLPGVDPDRPTVLRQLRALHDMGAANPDLVLVPAHDDAYLRGELLANAAIHGGFTSPPAN